MNMKPLKQFKEIYSYRLQSCDSKQHGASEYKLASYNYTNLELQNQKRP